MTLKERYAGALSQWEQAMPNPSSELVSHSEFQMLVAVILSAQCTDARVNLVTPALFQALGTPQAMAQATEETIFGFIKSVSYPNSKTRHLKAMAQMLIDDFNGIVPQTMEELTRLPGVGRKTANVMLGQVFNQNAIAVDTHVFRVANRMGLAHGKTPLEVETALVKHIPEHLQSKAHHWILLHGRYTCRAVKPQCGNCTVKQFCKSFGKL